MRSKLFAAIALAAGLGLSLAAAPASAVSITNGSFESGPNPGSFTTLYTGDTSINGWKVGGLSVDYIGNYWEASDGVRSIDLAGNGTGSISQVLTGLTSGVTYHVLFDLAGNPDGGGTLKTAAVSDAGSQVSLFNFSQTGNTASNMGWLTQQFDFVATGATANLVFSTTQNNAFGPAIDNVRFAGGVPEPATWAMMLLGFGGLGAMLRRRRQVAFA